MCMLYSILSDGIELRNQLESTLNIMQVDPDTGALNGTYISPSGTTGKEFPMVGWVNSSPKSNETQDLVHAVLTFTVRWEGIGSITAWTGYCNETLGVSTLTTLWHLVRPVSSFSWDHILTNFDVFKPMEE